MSSISRYWVSRWRSQPASAANRIADHRLAAQGFGGLPAGQAVAARHGRFLLQRFPISMRCKRRNDRRSVCRHASPCISPQGRSEPDPFIHRVSGHALRLFRRGRIAWAIIGDGRSLPKARHRCNSRRWRLPSTRRPAAPATCNSFVIGAAPSTPKPWDRVCLAS